MSVLNNRFSRHILAKTAVELRQQSMNARQRFGITLTDHADADFNTNDLSAKGYILLAFEDAQNNKTQVNMLCAGNRDVILEDYIVAALKQRGASEMPGRTRG